LARLGRGHDEAVPHDRVWRPAHRSLAVLLYQGESDSDKQEAVFGVSRAPRQQARDRDTTDLRSWPLTSGPDAAPDRHDTQPL